MNFGNLKATFNFGKANPADKCDVFVEYDNEEGKPGFKPSGSTHSLSTISGFSFNFGFSCQQRTGQLQLTRNKMLARYQAAPKDLKVSTNHHSYLVAKDVFTLLNTELKVANNEVKIDIDDPEGKFAKIASLLNGQRVKFERSDRKFYKNLFDICNLRKIPRWLRHKAANGGNSCNMNKYMWLELNKEFLGAVYEDALEIKIGQEIFKVNKLYAAVSKKIARMIDENPSQKVIELHDLNCSYFNLVAQYMNGKELRISIANMEKISQIAESLEIDTLKEEAEKYARELKTAQARVPATEEMLNSTGELQKILFSLNKDNISEVTGKILGTSWVSRSESVKELIRNILVLVDARFSLVGCITQLCKELAENDKFPALSGFKSFIVQCVFSHPHSRRGAFAYHIYQAGFLDQRKLVKYAKACMTQEDDNAQQKGTRLGKASMLFWFWFIPELVAHIPSFGNLGYWRDKSNIITGHTTLTMPLVGFGGLQLPAIPGNNNSQSQEKGIIEVTNWEEYKASNWKLYKTMRDKQSSGDACEEAILSNNSDELARILNDNKENVYNYQLPGSLFANRAPMSVLECSALYGSVNCVRFLVMNGASVTSKCKSMSVIGGNLEVIRMIKERYDARNQADDQSFDRRSMLGEGSLRGVTSGNTMSLAIEYHHNDVAAHDFEECFYSQIGDISILSSAFSRATTANNVHIIPVLLDSGVSVSIDISHALSRCCSNGYTSLVKALLPYMEGSNHRELLCSAIEGGSVDCVDAIMNMGGELNNEYLVVAVRSGRLEMVKYIMEHCDCKSLDSEVVTQMALNAVKTGCNDILDILMDVYCDVISGRSLLKTACVQNEIDLAEGLLPNIHLDSEFAESLIVACLENGSSETLQLIKNKYHNFYISEKIYQAIERSIEQGFGTIIEVILGDEDIDEHGEKLAKAAIQKHKDDIAKSILKRLTKVGNALWTAASENQIEIVKACLEVDSTPAVVNYCRDKGTVLYQAVSRGNLEMVNLLLKVPGIDVLAHNGSRKTPLLCAAENVCQKHLGGNAYVGGFGQTMHRNINVSALEIIDALFTHYKEHNLIGCRIFELNQVFQRLLMCEGSKTEEVTEAILYMIENVPGLTVNGNELILSAAKNGATALMKYLISAATGTVPVVTTATVCDAKVSSLYNEALAFEKRKDMAKAAEYYKMAADQGHTKAQCNYGCMIHSGYVPGTEKVEAVRYFKMSADSGNSSGMCNYGCCLETGQGIEKNVSEAIKYYKRAAAAGNRYAKANLERLNVTEGIPGLPINMNDHNEEGTALMNAILSRHETIVNMLLAVESVDLNFTTGNGSSALSIAITNENYKLAERIITDPRFSYSTKQIKALFAAVSSGNTELCRMIFALPNVSVNDVSNWTEKQTVQVAGGPVLQAQQARSVTFAHETALSLAIRKDADEIVDLCLGHPTFDPTAAATKCAINACVVKDKAELLSRLLDTCKLNVNVYIRGNSLLHHAVVASSEQVIKHIINDAVYDPVESNGTNCFRKAISAGNDSVIRIGMYSRGIDVNALLKTALELCRQSSGGRDPPKPLNVLMEHKDIDVNARINDLTVLMQIAQSGRAAPDNLLARPEIDVNAQDKSGETALMYAVRKGNATLVEQLMKRKDCRLDIKNHDDKDVVSILGGDAPTTDEELRAWISSRVNQRQSAARQSGMGSYNLCKF